MFLCCRVAGRNLVHMPLNRQAANDLLSREQREMICSQKMNSFLMIEMEQPVRLSCGRRSICLVARKPIVLPTPERNVLSSLLLSTLESFSCGPSSTMLHFPYTIILTSIVRRVERCKASCPLSVGYLRHSVSISLGFNKPKWEENA